MWATGCAEEPTKMDPEDISIDDYHGFGANATWTYRDDGVLDESPDDAVLLRARYTGDGVVDLRRGSRWADASRVAEIVFRLDTEFSITSWVLGPYSGTGDLPLGSKEPFHGQSVRSRGWLCSTVRRIEVETYYAFFDDVLQFQCSGQGGPEGNWTFAKDIGLVAYDGPEYSLSLVAPQ